MCMNKRSQTGYPLESHLSVRGGGDSHLSFGSIKTTALFLFFQVSFHPVGEDEGHWEKPQTEVFFAYLISREV